MTFPFQKVAVLGGGLLGGSLVLALQRLGNAPRAVLWARRGETVREAGAAGIEHATDDLASAVAGADCVVLAVPVGAMARLISDAVKAGLSRDALVTDVGSVKQAPHATVGAVLEPHGIDFIGSHPMAGSEKGGVAAASADLFRNAACLLTNDADCSSERQQAVAALWQAVGCRNTWMTAVEHDRLVARISHLPHILAAVGALVALKQPELGRFGGGGLRDTTRVAGGDPAMWAGILMENRAALVAPMRETLAELGEMLAMLESGDQEMLRNWLVAAKIKRDHLNTL